MNDTTAYKYCLRCHTVQPKNQHPREDCDDRIARSRLEQMARIDNYNDGGDAA